MKTEFKDMMVKDAIKELKNMLDFESSWISEFEGFMDKPLSYLPFNLLDKISDAVSSVLTSCWIIHMSTFGQEWEDYYRDYCNKKNIPWREYRKFFPNGKAYTDFAKNHIGELVILYCFYDTFVDDHKGEDDIFKKYASKTKDRKIGPLLIKKGGDYDFTEDMQVSLIPYLSNYYGYGRQPYESIEVFEGMKKDVMKLIKAVEEDGERYGGRVVF